MRTLFATLMLLVLSAAAEAGGKVEAIDDAGRTVSLRQPAQRIVSLAPHATELLFAAGAVDRVVGVSEFSTHPPSASRLPKIGGGAGLDMEAIAALQPDLVVAWRSGNSPAQVERLERLGMVVFRSEPRHIDAIATSLERLGVLAGTAERAREAAQAFRAGVADLRGSYRDAEPVRVFYQIWQQPLMTVNGEHMISDWLRVCGAVNVFADLPVLASTVSAEAVLQADPDVFVAGRYAGKGELWKQQWLRWPQLRAVAARHLYTVPAETMERQTPRALTAARELCGHIDVVRRAPREGG